jgi:phosphopantetheinyl transferase
MIAQVGSMLVEPGLALQSLENVHAHKWVQYRTTHVLELQGERLPDDPHKVRVTLHELESRPDRHNHEDGRLVYEGVAHFVETRSEPIVPEPDVPTETEACVFTAERLYDEQWLFHGPAMQALVEIGPISNECVSGTIEVLPLKELLPPTASATFHTDPIVVDTFTHLLGCWGLDRFEEGDVIFPLRMGRLSIFGETPAVGTRISCRIKVRRIEHHSIVVDADLMRPDGRLWMTIEDWADWRFYWPGRFRDVFRAPDVVFVGETLEIPEIDPKRISIVWLAPPADMARPVWREVLEQTQLAPCERKLSLALSERKNQRTHHIWERVAAKEAIRRLWLAEGEAPRYPADLAIEVEETGRPSLRDLAIPDRADLPRFSFAADGGVALAIAVRDDSGLVGIDIQEIASESADHDESPSTDREQALLAHFPPSSHLEWLARVRCAKRAAARAIGLDVRKTSLPVEVISINEFSGEMTVETVQTSSSVHPKPRSIALSVRTHRSDEYAWAWTIGEKGVQR